MEVHLAPMRAEHWEAVSAIYQAGIETGQATFETAVPTWAAWDAGHLAHGRLVALNGPEIVGWAALSPVSKRSAYAGVAEVSVYVAAAARGQGIGKRLLQALIDAAEAAGMWTLQSSVFPENKASVALHLACGFRVVGTRERIAQQHGMWRDTVLLERRSTKTGT